MVSPGVAPGVAPVVQGQLGAARGGLGQFGATLRSSLGQPRATLWCSLGHPCGTRGRLGVAGVNSLQEKSIMLRISVVCY